MGSAIAYNTYSNQNYYKKCQNNRFAGDFLSYSMYFTSIANIASCYSRLVINNKQKRLIRIVSFASQYSFVHIPIILRFVSKFYAQSITIFNTIFSTKLMVIFILYLLLIIFIRSTRYRKSLKEYTASQVEFDD